MKGIGNVKKNKANELRDYLESLLELRERTINASDIREKFDEAISAVLQEITKAIKEN